MQKKSTRIFLMVVYLFFALQIIDLYAMGCNDFNEVFLSKKFNIDSFRFIKNYHYDGIRRFNNIFNKDIIVVCGKYVNKKKYSTFLIILSCRENNLFLEKKFSFYSDSIDDIRRKNNKLYVIFKDETELFGWIECKNSKYTFTMFEDPEL